MLNSRSISAWLLLLTQVWTPVLSQTLPITVDKSVPSQRAVVGVGDNGVPVVNIARPTADGVSNNRFKQFNVGPSGVVFNNSGAPGQSQLAGAIAGNPLLGNGRAAVILNQVTTNNPSQLRGMMEVAGHRANVIIANPAGIVCDGCGFLNAHRGTLTTGRPMIGADGGLHGFDVTRGRLSVEGLGLLGTGVDKIDLIARTLTLNAAVWANRLNVVAGPATVGYGDDSVHAKAGEGPAPAVWLDMAALGGMYANSVRLIGTEAGVGVNIGGKLTSLTGDLHISSAGDVRILPPGDVYGSQGLNLSADGNLAVLGKATAQRDIQLTARQGLRVDGVVATADGAGLTLSGHDIDIRPTGKVHSGAALIADARGRLDTAGDIRATGDITLKSAGAMALAGSTVSHSGNVHLQSLAQTIAMTPSAHTQAAGTLNVVAQGTLLADGKLRAGQSVSLRAGGNLETRGIVYGNTDVTLASSEALVSRGTIVAGQFATLHANSSLENRGTLHADTGATLWTSGALINRGALVASTGDVRLDTQGELDNRDGTIRGGGKLYIGVSKVENQGGAILGRDLEIRTPGRVDNTEGLISGSKSLTIIGETLRDIDGVATSHGTTRIDAGTLENQRGEVWSGSGSSVKVERLTGKGRIASQGDIDFESQESLHHAGEITADGKVSVTIAHGDLHNSGTILSGRNATVRAHNVTNDGQIVSHSTAKVRAKGQLSNEGLINGIHTELGAQSIENTGRIYGDWVKIEADAVRNGPRQHDTGKNRKVGVIAAHDRIDMGVETFDNDHGHVYSGGDLNIGRRLDDAGNADGKAGVFNNRSGLVDVDGNLRFDVDIINNLNEHFVSEVVPGTTTRKVYYRRDGKDEKLDADKYWLCNYDKPVCSKNYKWLLRTPQRRLLMPSKQEKYNEPQYGPQLSYANRKHENLRRGQAPVQLPYSPPYELELSGRNYITVPEQFHYKIDAPIWDVFEVPRPASLPEPPQNPGYCSFDEQCRAQREAYEQAHAATVAAYQELNKRVRAFNRDFKSRLVGRFTIYDVNETVSESRTVSSDPATILVGGNATFNGKVLNDKSQIIAGGDLHTVGGQVRNIGATGERRTEATGKVIRTYTSNGGRKRKTADYHDAPRIEPIELAVATYDGNTPKPPKKGAILATGPGTTASDPSETFSLHRAGIGEVRTVAPPTSLPTSTLYTLALEANSSYLVNTDDHFVSQRPIISSDYLFELLGNKVGVGSHTAPAQPDALRFARPHSGPSYVEGFNGALLLKRLGDAFYEQRLVARQIMDATGQRFIGDYTDSQSQYKALLTAGATFGKQYGLTVGTALTEDQMRHLTSDIVWMVKRDVRLPDGTIQTVLAPQVYLMVQDGDLKGDGTLIAGRRIKLQADGDIVNTGTIGSRNATVMVATNIRNSAAGRIHGGSVDLFARQDLENIGARITGDDVALHAGRDVNLVSTKVDSIGTNTWRSHLDGLSRVDAGDLHVEAGRDVNVTAASLSARNDAWMSAGNDINLLTVRQTQGESIVFGNKNNSQVLRTQDIGTTVDAGGDLTLSAGANISATATRWNAGDALTVLTQGDIALNAGEQSAFARDEHYQKQRGFLSSQTTHSIDASYWSETLGAILSGRTVSMIAGGDIASIAAQVAAEKSIQLQASRNITLGAGEDTYGEQHYQHVTRRGFFGGGGGIGVAYGKESSTVWSSLDGTAQSKAPTLIGTTGGNVVIRAGQDVRITGGQVVAGSDPRAEAGAMDKTTGNIGIHARNITLDTNQDTERTTQGSSYARSTFGTAVVGTAVDTANNLGRAKSIRGMADEMAASGLTKPQVTLTHDATRSNAEGENITMVANGATLNAANHIVLRAISPSTGGEISLVGSTVQGGGATILDASNGVSIASATHRYSENHSSESKTLSTGTATAGLGDLGRTMSGGHNSSGVQLLPHNRQASTAAGQSVATWQTASTITGHTVTVDSQAGDVRVRGSNIAAQESVAIATREGSIHIEPGTHTHSSSESYRQATLGNIGNTNTSATAGYGKQSGSQQDVGRTQSVAGSQITSGTGDVTIGARERASVVGSQIIAARDVRVSAQDIVIDAGLDQALAQAKQENRQVGVTFSVNNPVVSAVETAHDMQQAAEKSDNERLRALAATAAGLATVNAYSAVAQNPASAGGISVNVDVGVSNSRHTHDSQSSTSSSSVIQGGRDVVLTASGAGSTSDITVRGSTVTAARNVTLQAEGGILLEATKNVHQSDSDRSSSSASVGVGFAVGGTQNGFTLNLAASTAHGETNGNSTTWTHAQVQAGGIAALQSGGDTTLIGAEVRGNQVVAGIGGNLGIQSVQDIATYASKEHSGGVGVSLCIPPFCYGVSSVSGNVGKGQLDSHYASVTQQSGLKAGEGGFQVHVGQNTNLVGGMITSSDQAVAQGLNHLDTGTLIWRDIENKASYSGEQIALGGGYSFGGAASGKDAKTGNDASSQNANAVGLDQNGNAASGTQAVPGKTLPGYNGISASVPIALQAKDRAESTTHSAISGGTITIRDRDGQLALTGQTPKQTIAALNRDTDNTLNTLAPIFDKEKIEAGFQIVSTLERESGTFLANKAREADAKAAALRRQAEDPNLTDAQRTALLSQAEEITNEWGPGGMYRRVISAGAAAVGGNVTGGAEQLVQAAAVNYLQGLAASEVKEIADAFGKGPEAEAARAALHALVGCTGSAASGASVGCGAGALGAAAGSVSNALVGGDSANMSAKQKEARRNLVASFVGGIAASTKLNAGTAVSAAIVETENNFLKYDLYTLDREIKAAKANGEDTAPIYEKYRKQGEAIRGEIAAACHANPLTCGVLHRDIANEAVVEIQSIVGMLQRFDDDVIALVRHETSKDNAAIDDHISPAGRILEYVADGGAILVGGNTALSAKGRDGGSAGQRKQPYRPNQGKVGNMKEFLEQPGFGNEARDNSQKTSRIFQGQSIYRASRGIGLYIKEDDQFYLDGQHKNHLEVFDKKGNLRAVLNLDGSYNLDKTQAATGRKLK